MGHPMWTQDFEPTRRQRGGRGRSRQQGHRGGPGGWGGPWGGPTGGPPPWVAQMFGPDFGGPGGRGGRRPRVRRGDVRSAIIDVLSVAGDQPVNVTNTGTAPQTVSARGRTIATTTSDQHKTVNLGSSPTFVDQFGTSVPFTQTTFTVPAGTDRLVADDAWPGPNALPGSVATPPSSNKRWASSSAETGTALTFGNA